MTKALGVADIFADTAGWANILDPRQPYHVLAAGLYREARRQRRKLITTNYVIAELVALLASPLRVPRPSVVTFIEGLRASPYVEVVHIDVTLDDRAWRLIKGRQDKQWSLVDCASFVVMQHRGLTDALTSDHHFEQAGFVRLLKA